MLITMRNLGVIFGDEVEIKLSFILDESDFGNTEQAENFMELVENLPKMKVDQFQCRNEIFAESGNFTASCIITTTDQKNKIMIPFQKFVPSGSSPAYNLSNLLAKVKNLKEITISFSLVSQEQPVVRLQKLPQLAYSRHLRTFVSIENGADTPLRVVKRRNANRATTQNIASRLLPMGGTPFVLTTSNISHHPHPAKNTQHNPTNIKAQSSSQSSSSRECRDGCLMDLLQLFFKTDKPQAPTKTANSMQKTTRKL